MTVTIVVPKDVDAEVQDGWIVLGLAQSRDQRYWVHLDMEQADKISRLLGGLVQATTEGKEA